MGDTTMKSEFLRWARSFWPARQAVKPAERWRAAVGAGLGILFTGLLCRWWAGGSGAHAWLVAPMGASAVLVFCLPASPLAQPWAVVGGNTLSVLVGAAVAMLVPDPALAGALAVAVAIGLMFLLRCLHPPGGAAALLAALGGVGLTFAVFPVLLNCLLLVAAGMAYNRLTGRPYPQGSAPEKKVAGSERSRFSQADLDLALAQYGQVLDVSRGDLETLLQRAEAASYQRRFGDLRCGDVMTPEPVTVQFGTALDDAWALMLQHRIKALPVIDRAGRIAGIVSRADFLRQADIARREGLGQRLRGLLQRSGLSHSERPEVVGQIMTRQVRVASTGRLLVDLVPLFSEDGHHHIPVIDGEQRLVGILTQSDLVRALYRASGG